MSKALAIVPAGPALDVAAPLIAAGMGAAWLAKKARDLAASLSPQDRAYLLPFGADAERLELEAGSATVPYEPFDGIGFGEARPAFRAPREGCPALPPANQACEPASVTHAPAAGLALVERAAQAAGFGTRRRALPAGASVVVFDLIQSEPVRALVPKPLRRKPS